MREQERLHFHFDRSGQIKTNGYNGFAVVATMPHEQESPIQLGKLRTKDRADEVRHIEPGILEPDCYVLAQWLADDPTIAGHLDSIPLPRSHNTEDIQEAASKIMWYYQNKSHDPVEQAKILPLVARNIFDDMLGVLTIRLKDDPYVPKATETGLKIASIEGLVVDPTLRRRGIATKLAKEALHIIFVEKDYDQALAWVLTDPLAGDYQPNIEFFLNKLQFGIAPYGGSWKDYQKRRNIHVDDRSALWFCMEKEKYLALVEQGAL